MKLTLLVITALTNIALASPINTANTTKNLDTTSATPSQPLDLTLTPAIINPTCSSTYALKITVRYISSGDPSGLSAPASQFLDFLGGAKGSKDVDVTFICPGQPISGTGSDDSRIKVVFFTQSDQVLDAGKKDEQDLPASMQVTWMKTNFVMEADVQLLVKADAKKETSKFDGVAL